VISLAVSPKDKAGANNFSKALQKFRKEDPTFRVHRDEESSETIISGMGELHLEVYIERMKREFQCEVIAGKPQVAYRETIGREAAYDYTHKKQTGGSGQFAKVKIAFEPLPSDAKDNFEFTSEVVGGRVPKEYIPGVEKGLKSAKDTGFLAGFPVVRLKTTLLDGAYHDVDSSVLAFEIAARSAFREAMEKAGPIILEPIMKVEVVTPEDYMGDVIGDINSRRGQIQNLEGRDVAQVITAKVPLAAMFGYVNNLRSLSQGRASYSMEFDCYEAVPSAVAEEIKAKKA
jgi:elongation factor G